MALLAIFSANARVSSTGDLNDWPALSSFSSTMPVRLPLTAAVERTTTDSSRSQALPNSMTSRIAPTFTLWAIRRSASRWVTCAAW